ncbi:MAG: ORF6N domain-containing protein [Candidatus Cloacimonetes bacterium]|nr:ORF6N domain-containing protein [Candidatus Cloacimonadota bacterium]
MSGKKINLISFLTMYGIKVKRLNEQVKRNVDRFPNNYRFQLNDREFKELVAKCDQFKMLKHSSVNPHAYTEAGVAMLSAVLHTPIAIQVSVKIINAFIAMRKLISTNIGFIQRIENVEQKQIETDKKIDQIFNALENKELVPKCGIFFEGQVFDAYSLVI